MNISLNILTWKSKVFPNQSNTELLNLIAKKISILAVGIFSTYTNYRLFVPWFCSGVLIGGYHKYFEEKKSCDHKHSSSGCSTGWLENATGIRLPAPISLGIQVAGTLEHIDHHPRVFVPAVSLVLGYWFGQNILELGCLFSRKWSTLEVTPLACQCAN